MRVFLEDRRHTRRAAHDYAFETTGLDRDAERTKYAAYLERYGVPPEVVSLSHPPIWCRTVAGARGSMAVVRHRRSRPWSDEASPCSPARSP